MYNINQFVLQECG